MTAIRRSIGTQRHHDTKIVSVFRLRHNIRMISTKNCAGSQVMMSLTSSFQYNLLGQMKTQRRYNGEARGFVQGFIRLINKPAVPTVGPRGDAIDRDKLIFQFDQFIRHLNDTSLVETIHLLDPFPSFESISPADTLFSMREYIVQLPCGGREHRISERNDIVRFARGLGAHGSIGNLFEDRPEFRLHGGDVVALPETAVVALGHRTNLAAVEKLREVKWAGVLERIPTNCIDMGDSAPQLSSYFGFGGDSTLIAWDNDDGNKVLDFVAHMDNTRAWNTCKVRPHCNFCTFAAGIPRYEVLVEEEDEESFAALMNSPLTPIPTPWSELKKAGVSMRSCLLVMMFHRGGFGAGGFQAHNADSFRSGRSVPKSRGVGKYAYRPKFAGDKGAPFQAMMDSWEVPNPVYQPPPRYRPPMHGTDSTSLTPVEGSERF